MYRMTFWGDFKANAVDHLNLSGELMLLLNRSELNVVNFEAPVASKGKAIRKSGPCIKQHVESPQWIESHGFNAVSLANNHIMDFGEEGLNETKNAFSHSVTMGAGEWDDAYKVHVFTMGDGTRIGLICCTQREFGTLTDKWSDKDKVGTAWVLNTDIQQLINSGGGVNLDLKIVVCHGGVEYMDQPLPEWRNVYRSFIDLGADAVIASHPHVPQGWEFYKGKLICYSLGNFCFQKKAKKLPKHWNESLCCIIEGEKDKGYKVTMRPLEYRSDIQYICDNHSDEFKRHIAELNSCLNDDTAYMEMINKSVSGLLNHYLGLFSRSGWIAKLFSKETLKGVIERFDIKHALNNIACESHRWAIIRALKLRHNI